PGSDHRIGDDARWAGYGMRVARDAHEQHGGGHAVRRGEQGAEPSALMAASADAGHGARTHRGTERRAGKSSARMHAPVERHVPGNDGASAAAMEVRVLMRL
ncbi:MAG: hypothetical protein ACPIOQ_42145, partial [Promethearchaeia archaeon]